MNISSKIHYHSAERIRLLELMCITQFLPGAHNVMISDACVELGTRRKLVLNFYDNQVAIGKERIEFVKRLEKEAQDPLLKKILSLVRGLPKKQ